MFKKWIPAFAGMTALLFFPMLSHAFPSTVRDTISIGLSSPVAFAYDETTDLLYSAAGETLRIIDVATLALASDDVQAYEISEDDDLTGSIQGFAIDPDNDRLFATQDGGKLLTYTLSDLTTAPTQVTILSTASLTFIAVNPASGIVYLYDATNRLVYTYNPESQTTSQIEVAAGGLTSFTVNAMRFIPASSGSGHLVLTTSSSRVYIIDAGTGLSTPVAVDLVTSTESLKGVAGSTDGTIAYVVNASDSSVEKISLTSASLLGTIDLSENSALTTIEIADVTNPAGTYGFVSGSNGLSIFDTSDDGVFDLDEGSAEAEPLPATASGPMVITRQGDLLINTGSLTLVSDNPYITIDSVTYSTGGTAMGTDGSATIAFTADEAGTYSLYAGGTLDADGTLITDSNAATSGSATADAATSVTFSYAANSAGLAEGDNTVYVFVEDAEGNIGHRATTISVDTPPPVVTITGTGFGNNRGYINVTRLDANDITAYRAFVSTSADEILTTTTVSASAGQSAEGTDPTITVTGLDNGTTYYVAVDAIDTNSNVSASRTTTISTGGTATILPQSTYGPAGLAGERGCALIAEVAE